MRGAVMEYPLIVEGKNWGAVRVYSEGLFTVFEAGCRAYEGILRLSVYGQGREGYLGICSLAAAAYTSGAASAAAV